MLAIGVAAEAVATVAAEAGADGTVAVGLYNDRRRQHFAGDYAKDMDYRSSSSVMMMTVINKRRAAHLYIAGINLGCLDAGLSLDWVVRVCESSGMIDEIIFYGNECLIL